MRYLPILCLIACGSASQPIKTSSPAGMIDGKSWAMTKASISKSGDDLNVKLFGDEVADCAFSSSTSPYVLFSVPAKVGTRPLKLSFGSSDSQTLTFVTPPSSNNIATTGSIEISELTDTTVKLGLYAKAGDSEVNGTVSTTLCK